MMSRVYRSCITMVLPTGSNVLSHFPSCRAKYDSRDCSNYNIMLDASDMYPDGFHPIHQSLDLTWKTQAQYRERHEAENVKYYFIDFGISSHFTDPAQPRLVLGKDCQDREVPELSTIIRYDPFPVDIFILGNVYRNYFAKVRTRSSPSSSFIVLKRVC